MGIFGIAYQPFHYWARDVVTNMEFRVEPYINRLIIIRTDAIQEVMDAYNESPYDDMKYSNEDIYFSLKLWSLGWVVGVNNRKSRDQALRTVSGGKKQYFEVQKLTQDWKNKDAQRAVDQRSKVP